MKIQYRQFISLVVFLSAILLGAGCAMTPPMYPHGTLNKKGKPMPDSYYRVVVVNNCEATVSITDGLGNKYFIPAREVRSLNIIPSQGDSSRYEVNLHAQVGPNGIILSRVFSFYVPSYNSYSQGAEDQEHRWTITQRDFDRAKSGGFW